jgi:hypothetical protein
LNYVRNVFLFRFSTNLSPHLCAAWPLNGPMICKYVIAHSVLFSQTTTDPGQSPLPHLGRLPEHQPKSPAILMAQPQTSSSETTAGPFVQNLQYRFNVSYASDCNFLLGPARNGVINLSAEDEVFPVHDHLAYVIVVWAWLPSALRRAAATLCCLQRTQDDNIPVIDYLELWRQFCS